MMRIAAPALLLCGLTLAAWGADASVALRVEQFTVPPATGPVMHILVKNLRDGAWRGKVSVRAPEGWQLRPTERAASLGPGETKRLAFTVAEAAARDANAYPIEAVAIGDDGSRASRTQQVACASAPFHRPRIDGRIGDWADAIPLTFVAGGKRTVVRAYWNPDEFCLLIEVEEDKRIGYRKGAEHDAVQVALAPREPVPGAQPPGRAGRYEFLLVGSASIWTRDRCFLLAKPDTPLTATQQPRELAPLELREANLRVRRRRGVTCYECALPLSAMPTLAPTEGREFCLSLLVHDPDGTGLRDLGEAAGLWPWQRSRLAWSLWQGARWGEDAPFDSRIEWGFCSSRD